MGILSKMHIGFDYGKTVAPTRTLSTTGEAGKPARKRLNSAMEESVLLATLTDKVQTFDYLNIRRGICQKLAPFAFATGDRQTGDAEVAQVLYASMEFFAARGRVNGNSYSRISKAVQMIAANHHFNTEDPAELWRVLDLQFSSPAANLVHDFHAGLAEITLENGVKPSEFITRTAALLQSYRPNTDWEEIQGYVLSLVLNADREHHDVLADIATWAESEGQDKSMDEWESRFRRFEERERVKAGLAAIAAKGKAKDKSQRQSPTSQPPASPAGASPASGAVMSTEQLKQLVAAFQQSGVAPPQQGGGGTTGDAAGGAPAQSQQQQWALQWQQRHGVLGKETPNAWPRAPLWAAKIMLALGKTVPADLAEKCPPGKMLGPDCPCCAMRFNPIADDKWYYHPRDKEFDGRLRPTGADKQGTMFMHELKFCPTVRDWVHRHVRINTADMHLFDPLPQGANAAVAP